MLLGKLLKIMTFYLEIVIFLLLSPSHVIGLVVTFDGPSTTTLSEDATDEYKLTLITLTGITTGQTVTCDINPPQTEFWVKLDPSSGKYGVYQKAMPGFSFATTPSYTLTVECTDSVSTLTKTYTVNIDKNDSPTISNLHNYTTLSAVSTPTGTLVFSVLSTDPENDTLSYSLDCYVLSVLATCPFEIYGSGEIVTTSDLVTTTVTSYDLRVTVTDSHNNQIGPQSLVVTVNAINTVPVINSNNLPYTTVVLENYPLGSSVYQVEITDPDAGDIHTYTASFTPAMASNYFVVDSTTGLISTSTVSNIDYDTLSATFTSCALVITVSDNYGSDTGTLTINIANVNEAPVFAKTLYTLSGNESGAGTSFGTPSYGVTDPDGDATTFGIDCVTFNIDTSSGEITLSIDYDRDDASVASSVTCGVSVSDGVLSSTATLQVYINTKNDNSPQFSQNSYSFHVSPYAQVGTVIDSVTATDADLGSDGVVSYEVRSGNYSDTFGVDTSGNMYVRQPINDTVAGTIVSVTVRAYDIGYNWVDVEVSFVVQSTTTTVTTTTTDRNITFFESPANVAWFAALMMILSAFAVYLVVEAYRSKLIFKICSSCSECSFPKWKRKFKPDNKFSDDDFEDDTPTPPPLTPVSSDKLQLGWSPWNSADKPETAGFF